MPAHGSQFMLHPFISRPVALNFSMPERHVRLRHHEIPAALMPMPEAAVHEDHRAILAKHDVGPARQPTVVQPVAEAPAEQKPPHQHLRFGVLAADGRHVPVALFFCQTITHVSIEVYISESLMLLSGKFAYV